MSLTSANSEEEGQPEPDLFLKKSKGKGRGQIFCFTACRRSAMDGRARRACEPWPDAANRSPKTPCVMG